MNIDDVFFVVEEDEKKMKKRCKKHNDFDFNY